MSRQPRGNFIYHKPDNMAVAAIKDIRRQCRVLHEALEALPQNREISVAITKLEEVSMWANKGIVLENGEPDAE